MGCASSKTGGRRRDDVRLVDDSTTTTTTTEARVKLVLLGASGAGKTALSTRFVRGTLEKALAEKTVGVETASNSSVNWSRSAFLENREEGVAIEKSPGAGVTGALKPGAGVLRDNTTRCRE